MFENIGGIWCWMFDNVIWFDGILKEVRLSSPNKFLGGFGLMGEEMMRWVEIERNESVYSVGLVGSRMDKYWWKVYDKIGLWILGSVGWNGLKK